MSNFFEKFVRPVLFNMDAESAHDLGVKALRSGLVPAKRFSEEELARLQRIFGPIRRFGLNFANPLGLAAGFDKNGVVVNQLAGLGFGFVEVGTVTFDSQPGNPKPRLFRLPEDRALINRLGFNNDGAKVISERIGKMKRRCIVGVNIGRNKDVANEDAVENYLKTFETIHPVADYIAINVSSPNTPNLRELQSSENLEGLISAIQKRNHELGEKPLLIKVAPDLDDAGIESVVSVCIDQDVSGIIATNTTISRKGLSIHPERFGDGGLSGRPLADRSDEVIEKIFRYSRGRFPIIGVGGVFSGEEAFKKVVKGASLIQAYTGFIYRGPSFANDVLIDLSNILERNGFASLDDAVGSSVQ